MAESHGVGGVTWSSLGVLDESDVVESPGRGRATWPSLDNGTCETSTDYKNTVWRKGL